MKFELKVVDLASRSGKRVLDLAGAAVAGIVAVPTLLLLAVILRYALGTPVFFRQERVGLDGRLFKVLKFRTMHDARGVDGSLLPDAQRITSIGAFLRKTSLDELPSLWNVLIGDMSLVGPRPLLPEYMRLYSTRQMRRHDVRPGLTGWAQVNGRNDVDWATRLEMDVWYVENRNLALDLKILALTLLKVLRREGISSPGHATMEPFRGEH